MGKKLFTFVVFIIITTLVAHADTWTDPETGCTWTYTISGEAAEVSGVSPATGDITIPSTLGGCPVTGIGDGVFEGCSELTSVAIPGSVTNIGRSAFYECSSLSCISFAGDAPVVGAYALPCRVVRVPIGAKGYDIDENGRWNGACVEYYDAATGETFQPEYWVDYKIDSEGLLYGIELHGATEIVVPDEVTSITSGVFCWKSRVTSIIIPDSVNSMDGWFAFSNCASLERVVLPSAIELGIYDVTYESFGDEAGGPRSALFVNCPSLKDVTFPGKYLPGPSWTHWGDINDTVYGSMQLLCGDSCEGITNVTLNGQFDTIPEYAFRGCSALESITLMGDAPTVGTFAFSDVAEGCVVRVPAGAKGYDLDEDGKWNGLRVEYYVNNISWGNTDSGATVYDDERVINESNFDFKIPATKDLPKGAKIKINKITLLSLNDTFTEWDKEGKKSDPSHVRLNGIDSDDCVFGGEAGNHTLTYTFSTPCYVIVGRSYKAVEGNDIGGVGDGLALVHSNGSLLFGDYEDRASVRYLKTDDQDSIISTVTAASIAGESGWNPAYEIGAEIVELEPSAFESLSLEYTATFSNHTITPISGGWFNGSTGFDGATPQNTDLRIGPSSVYDQALHTGESYLPWKGVAAREHMFSLALYADVSAMPTTSNAVMVALGNGAVNSVILYRDGDEVSLSFVDNVGGIIGNATASVAVKGGYHLYCVTCDPEAGDLSLSLDGEEAPTASVGREVQLANGFQIGSVYSCIPDGNFCYGKNMAIVKLLGYDALLSAADIRVLSAEYPAVETRVCELGTIQKADTTVTIVAGQTVTVDVDATNLGRLVVNGGVAKIRVTDLQNDAGCSTTFAVEVFNGGSIVFVEADGSEISSDRVVVEDDDGVCIYALNPDKLAIRNVTARQRRPWNGKVDIKYTLLMGEKASQCLDGNVALKITATDNATGETYVADASALLGDTGTAAGAHHIVWDLNAQGLELNSDDVVFTVAYVEPSLYCVIDLSAGANAESYPVSYLAGVPEGGWSDEYKTTKLVLRRIEPGDIPTRDARITKPFYIGVFEVTQKQYELVMGTNPSQYKGDMRPVEQVSYNMIRGSSNGAQWPASSEVDLDSFIGRLRAKTGVVEFDLPTEAQWEYACRAGTTSEYNNGGNSVDDLKMLGRYSGNTSDGKGGYSQQTTVGSYLPNAWGLYDMHGNVWEICLDWYGNQFSGNDPVGPSSGSMRLFRGGSWRNDANTSSSQIRGTSYAYSTSNDFGFRLVRTLSETSSEQSHGAERADALCSAEAAPVAIDSRMRPVVESSIVLAWDASWIGGDIGATVVISDNGEEIARKTGEGAFEYALAGPCYHELTYKTLIDGEEQEDVYTATLFKEWKYEVDENGDAVILGTSTTSGELMIPSGIDGYEVTDISESAFVGCDGITSLTMPGSMLDSARPGFYEAEFTNIYSLDRNVSIVDTARGVTLSAEMMYADTISEYTMYAYAAYMYFEGGVTYNFLADYDDYSGIKVDDTVVITPSSSQCRRQTGSIRFAESGWHWLELRGHNYGGPGAINSGNQEGLWWWTSKDSTKRKFEDPGDGSMFRIDNITNSSRNIQTLFPDSYDKITSVTLTGEAERITAHAFAGCSAITNIVMPEGVVKIGEHAFSGCSSLESIAISASVTNIGVAAFAECGSLKTIDLSDGNEYYKILNGMLVSVDETELIAMPVGIDEIVIPEGMTKIVAGIVPRCENVTSLTLGNSALFYATSGVGLWQAKFNTRFDTTSMIDDAEEVDVVSGPIAAYTYLDSAPWEFTDPITGSVYSWNERNTTFAYFGMMYMDAGKTYVFGAHFDDDAYVKVDGQELINITTSSKYSVYKGQYYCAETGWHDVEFRLGDNHSGKGSWGYYWTLDFGLGYRDDGGTSTTQSQWKSLLDPGDGSLFRRYGGASYCDLFPNVESIMLTEGVTSVPPGAFDGYTNLTSVTLPAKFMSQFGEELNGCQIDYIAAVRFEDRGEVSTTYIPCGFAIGELPPLDPRDGYSMPGVWSNAASGGEIVDADTVVTGDMTLCAIWTADTFTVTLDQQGGIGGTSVTTATYDSDMPEITVPTREGYTFCGYYSEVDGAGTQYYYSNGRSAAIWDITGDMTLFALWQINQYRVTFNANGGTGGWSTWLYYNTPIEDPSVSRAGHTFLGWTPDVASAVPASNVYYTAQWEIHRHSVVFDANGGEGGWNETMDYGTDVVVPEVSRIGWTFMGWDKEIAATVPDEDVTYTAQWEINQYTVTFDANGGVGGLSAMQDYDSEIVPPVVSRVGCTFEGWLPSPDAKVPDHDVEYVAQWKVWDITVDSAASSVKELYSDDYFRITNIVIGAEVECLPAGFFDGCDALESLAFLSPDTELGDNDLRTVGRLYETQPDGYWIVQGVLFGYKGDCPREIPELDSVKRVVDCALDGCKALEELNFTAESVLTTIGTNAFKHCTELQRMTLPPSLEEIGDEAFMGCSYLGNVIVPGSVKCVGDRAFKNCTGFTAAQIEYGVEALGEEAFFGDWRISEVDIPSTVTNIGINAFGGDSSIIRVGLRGDVRKASEIFSNYEHIREATVKDGDGEIVEGLFSGFKWLQDVHFLGNCPSLGGDGGLLYAGTPAKATGNYYSDITNALVTYVAKDSTGWDGTPGSHSLPQAWPLVEGSRRSIAWWDVPTYLCQFDANGGTLGVQDTYQYSERLIMLPPEPVQTGYRFAGWWTEPIGGLPVTADTIFIEGVYTHLYAHWIKGHWVFLDPNGGTVVNDFITYVEESVYGVLPVPVKSGYAFGGWLYNGYKIEPETEINEKADHTLVAQWTANLYSVRYNANGGSGDMAEQGFVYGVEQELRKNLFARSGYEFIGWATNAVDAVGLEEETDAVVYADCESVTNLTAVADGWIELFAVWKESDVLPDPSNLDFHFSGDAKWELRFEGVTVEKDGETLRYATVWRSGSITNNLKSVLVANVYGAGKIGFWWRVSCESFRDWKLDNLEFAIDGVAQEPWINGEKDWAYVEFEVDEPGDHTLTWTYSKDGEGSEGEDCGWITAAVWTPRLESLGDYVNCPALEFSSGGDAAWRGDEEIGHDGIASLRSGAIGDGEVSTLEAEVEGAGRIGFWWKVSSEAYRTFKIDYVSFSIDDVEQAWMGGEIAWTNVAFDVVGSGTHTLRWEYRKDDWVGTKAGEDCAWLDEVVWTPKSAVPTVEIDGEKMEAAVVDEESGTHMISAKEGQMLTEEDVASVTISSPLDSSDITEAYVKTLVDNQIIVELATPAVESVEEEDKDEDDPSGMLANVELEQIEEKPEPKEGEEVGALPVKTYPGLYYQVSWGDDLGDMTTGEKVQATGEKLYLGVIKQTGDKGFYKISVSEE